MKIQIPVFIAVILFFEICVFYELVGPGMLAAFSSPLSLFPLGFLLYALILRIGQTDFWGAKPQSKNKTSEKED